MSDQTQPSGRASWPLVSVLIPAYNHARFVQRCLDSVLEDPYPCKEIVIIDDGSSDATGEKIAQWIATHGHRLPVQFVQRDNRGVAATLNELALRARGDYLRIVASDDYLIPGESKCRLAISRGIHPSWLSLAMHVLWTEKDEDCTRARCATCIVLTRNCIYQKMAFAVLSFQIGR